MVFTLTAAVVFGPAAGTAIVAIDSLVISGCLKRSTVLTLEKFLFNAAAPPVAMWISALVFFRASGIQPLYMHRLGLDVVGRRGSKFGRGLDVDSPSDSITTAPRRPARVARARAKRCDRVLREENRTLKARRQDAGCR
jgi:hypothetical protein